LLKIDRNVSWVDKEEMHYFITPKLTKSWGLLTHKVGNHINVRFGNDEPRKLEEVASHVTK